MSKGSLGIDHCDNLYLCYHEGKILFTSKPKHGDWTSPEELSFGDGKRYNYAMALNPNTAAVHVALIRYFYSPAPADYGELFYGSNSSGTWEFTRIDSSDYGGYGGRAPSIAIDSVGNIHLIWAATYYDTSLSHYISRIIYSVNSGGEWETQVAHSASGEYKGITLWLEVEKDGVAHIMWQIGSVYHLKNDILGGTTWTMDVLSQFPTIYYWGFVDFRVDRSHNLHMIIVGVNYWGGPSYIYYYFRPAGSAVWEDPELVCDQGCSGRIAFDSQWRPHLILTIADVNFCDAGLGYSFRDESGWHSYEIVGENYDYEYTLEPWWLGFVFDSDLNGHVLFAACEGYPIPRDSIEIFHYAALDRFDIGHVVFLLNYLFREGPAPSCEENYDLNCDEELTAADIVVLINYLFRGESLPDC